MREKPLLPRTMASLARNAKVKLHRRLLWRLCLRRPSRVAPQARYDRLHLAAHLRIVRFLQPRIAVIDERLAQLEPQNLPHKVPLGLALVWIARIAFMEQIERPAML